MLLPELQPLSVGEILDRTFDIYRRQFWRLLTIAVVSLAIPYGLNAYVMSMANRAVTPTDFGAMFLWLFVSVMAFAVFQAVATAATVHLVSESYLSKVIGPGEALQRTVPAIWGLIVVWLSVSLAVFFGLLFFVVPGVILAVGLAFSTQVYVLERTAPLEAMRRSWYLAKGRKGHVFILMLTAGVILVVALVGTMVAFMLLSLVLVGSPEPGESPGFLATALDVITLVIQLLVFPIFPCLLTVTYYDLRVRKEGFDLEVLAQAVQRQRTG